MTIDKLYVVFDQNCSGEDKLQEIDESKTLIESIVNQIVRAHV